MTKEFITKTDLISKRKWTYTLLKKYMPEPDQINNKPQLRWASKIKRIKIN